MTDGPRFLAPRRRVDGSITLAEPDPGWQEAYCHAEERVPAALGPRALRVEHVGSTYRLRAREPSWHEHRFLAGEQVGRRRAAHRDRPE